jgi:hypothetical protein
LWLQYDTDLDLIAGYPGLRVDRQEAVENGADRLIGQLVEVTLGNSLRGDQVSGPNSPLR